MNTVKRHAKKVYKKKKSYKKDNKNKKPLKKSNQQNTLCQSLEMIKGSNDKGDTKCLSDNSSDPLLPSICNCKEQMYLDDIDLHSISQDLDRTLQNVLNLIFSAEDHQKHISKKRGNYRKSRSRKAKH